MQKSTESFSIDRARPDVVGNLHNPRLSCLRKKSLAYFGVCKREMFCDGKEQGCLPPLQPNSAECGQHRFLPDSADSRREVLVIS
jgi:hypothetical protein